MVVSYITIQCGAASDAVTKCCHGGNYNAVRTKSPPVTAFRHRQAQVGVLLPSMINYFFTVHQHQELLISIFQNNNFDLT